MENKKTLEQVQQLKLNVTNIHSFLVKENKRKKKLASNKEKEEKKKLSIKKSKERERKLETRRKVREDQVYSGAQVSPKEGNIFEKLLEFGALVLSGILVNALPKIIEEVKKIVDAIVNFVTPIQSGFNLIKAFFEGDIDKSKYDADKKRVDDGLKQITGKGGLIDQLAEKAGPLEGIIKSLRPAVDRLLRGKGAKNIVLAKKGGKEGVLNKETGEFTERQFTSAEREQYESERGQILSQGDLPELPPTGHIAGQKYGASRPGGRIHAGTDFDAGPNDVFYSRIGGEVLRVLKQNGGYGNYIDIYNKKLNVTERIAEGDTNLVKVGDVISPGTPVQKGTSQTGVFHYEIRKGSKETYGYDGTIDPLEFLRNLKSTPKPAKITPKPNNKMDQAKAVNKPDPRKRSGSTTVAVQQVNTIQYLPYMMPMPVASKSFASSQPTELSPIFSWGA